MGVFDRFLGKKDSAGKAAKGAVAPTACPHVALAPHWDRSEDIGHEDRATSFVCDSCHQTFTAQEAKLLRETETARLKEQLNIDTPT